MNKGEITKEQLLKVVQRLNGWKFHELLTDDPNAYGFWFSNGAGQFININYRYGKKLPQWSLCYHHPKTKNRVIFCSIGCAIDRPVKAIVNTLNNRLLSHLSELFLELKSLTEKYQAELVEKEREEYMLLALKRILHLSEYHDHRYVKAFQINRDCKRGQIGTLKKWLNKDSFRITIDDVNPEQIIKIIKIVDESALR